nr:MAG TPA: hypothetical protein [Caudoviricetes sp.]
MLIYKHKIFHKFYSKTPLTITFRGVFCYNIKGNKNKFLIYYFFYLSRLASVFFVRYSLLDLLDIHF